MKEMPVNGIVREIPAAFDLKGYLQNRRDQVNQALTGILGRFGQGRRLIQAMTYSVNAGGKRLRPILCLAASEVFSDAWPEVMPAACALELIHTYSLIHDDLPAMDDDTLRRGKPTCHVAFDEATAILAGDALLTLAFEILCEPKTGAKSPSSQQRWMKAAHVIASAAGCGGMVEGQMQDMAAEGVSLSADVLERLHALKTGALIRASVESGAILSGANDDEIHALNEYAKRIGLAFQVADDILNVTGDAAVMGKAVGTDSHRGKNTYPALLGLAEAKKLAENLAVQAVGSLDVFGRSATPLRAVAGYIISRNH